MSASGSGTPPVSSVDPRSVITPESFAVAPELIGAPLARPARRAAAMLLDLLPLAILVNANALFFAIVAAALLWRASRPDRIVRAGAPAAKSRRVRRAFMRATAALFVFIVVLRVVGATGDREDEEPGVVVNASGGALVSPTVAPVEDDSAIIAYGRALASGDAVELDRLLPRARTAVAGPRLLELETEVDRLNQESNALQQRLERQRGGPFTAALTSVADDLGIGFGWTALYFTGFLALWNGRTPGKRLVGIRVIRLDGKSLGWWIAFERFGGYAAAISTGLLGFLQILWDRNRQGIHDKVAGTVVIRVPRGWSEPIHERRR